MQKKSLSELVQSAQNQAASGQDDYDPNSMPVAQARQYIRDFLSPVTETETLPLRESLGRILAEDILSPHNVPNHDNSAMDGYAFNAASISDSGTTQLTVVGTAFAGKLFAGKVVPGECIRIMTGAVVPADTDTVIAQEHVTADGDQISFNETPKRGMNVRYAGEDLQQGQAVLAAGHLMRPADLGLVASLGTGEIKVYRKLRVAFFSTGDELVSIGQVLKEGQLYDSNRYTLYGMLVRMGVEIHDLGVIADDPALLEKTLTEAASKADVILTSGGVSVGEADFMKQLLEKLGQVLFWKIAMKPGRPLAYGKVGNAHYFGLPGNPVAVMVTFYQFVREAMLVLMGQPVPPATPLLDAICTAPIKKLKGRTEFQRGILYLAEDGSWKVKPTGNQGSGILSSMSLANCFIVLDDDVGNLDAGTSVQVQVMDGVI
ncbi:MAG TPA: gephyrin-like molybdotransferase Glp [Methylophilaceae bacterium]|nr:gephyrin-like molybdotransferase Glp [Methylophilaceae bacterium]